MTVVVVFFCLLIYSIPTSCLGEWGGPWLIGLGGLLLAGVLWLQLLRRGPHGGFFQASTFSLLRAGAQLGLLAVLCGLFWSSDRLRPAEEERNFLANGSDRSVVRVGTVVASGVSGSSGWVFYRIKGDEGQIWPVFSSRHPPPEEGQSVRVMLFAQTRETDRIILGWAEPWGDLFRWRSEARSWIFRQWDRLPPGPAGFSKALIIGMTDGLSPGEIASFRDSGTSHILALSGFHLSLFAGMLTWALSRFIGRFGGFFWAALVLTVYVFIAGPIPSLIRAYVMFLAGGVFFAFKSKVHFMDLLSISFLIVAIVDPPMTRTLSLQLSFLSLAGIALGADLGSWGKYWLGTKISQALAASVMAVLATGPLVGALFGDVHPIGIVLSLPLELLTILYTYLSLIFMILSACVESFGETFAPAIQGLGLPVELVYHAVFGLTRWGAGVPGLTGSALVVMGWICGLSLAGGFVYKGRMDKKATQRIRQQNFEPMEFPVKVNYDSPSEIRQLLHRLGLNTLKRWGQNFLINRGAREKILGAMELLPGEAVWEIGPGLGSMTSMLVERGHPLTVFEIDPGYADFLEKEFGPKSLTSAVEGSAQAWFRIIRGDVVKTWKTHWLEAGPPAKVIGNLPYNAASAILASFIDGLFFPRALVITVQKEMAERMTASAGTKNYSSFSILCQSAFEVVDKGDLKPGSFFPAPEVTSTVIQLKPHDKYSIRNRASFQKLVREIFASRRKTIRNNLNAAATSLGMTREALELVFTEEGIDLGQRAEQLSVQQFVQLANRLSQESATVTAQPEAL